VTESGNVGIGTTAPGAKLEIDEASNAGGPALHITNSDNPVTDETGQTSEIDFRFKGSADSGSSYIETYGARILAVKEGDWFGVDYADWKGGLAFWTLTSGASGAERMRIDSNGNVGIGTTNPGYKLHVISDASTETLRVAGSGGALRTFLVENSSGSTLFEIYASGQSSFPLGNVGINDTTPTYKLDVNGTIRGYGITDSSDERLKKNIVTLDNTLNKISQLRGVYYDWRTDEYPELSLSTSTQIGLIAQELETQYPELVDTDTEGFKSIQYGKLTGVLVEGIKELNTKVDLITGTSTDFSNLSLSGTTTVSNLNISDKLCFGVDCKTSWNDIVYSGDTDNWDTAFGWGDHSQTGYLTEYTELDPVFLASTAADITSASTTNWQTAYLWGDHSTAGYITPSNEKTDGYVLSVVDGSLTWVATSTLGFTGGTSTTTNNYYADYYSYSTTTEEYITNNYLDPVSTSTVLFMIDDSLNLLQTQIDDLGAGISVDLSQTGNILPSADNTYNIGSPTNKYANIYGQNIIAGDLVFTETESAVSGDTIQVGDILSLYVTQTDGDTHTVPIDFRTAINTANYGAGNIHFNTTGNMGLGFASSTEPEGKLHIYTSKTSGDFRLLTLQNYQGDGNISYQMSINQTDGNLQFTSNDNSQGSLINNAYSAWNMTIGGADDYWGIKRSPTGSLSYSDVLRITNTGNIGIGTTTPQAPLHITDTAGGTTDYLFMVSTTTSATSDEYMVITSDGDIGFGTTTPLSKLSIQGTAGSSNIFAIASSTGANLLTMTKDGNLGIGTTTPDAALTITASAGLLTGNQFLLQVASTTNSTIENALVVTADGNVGIGTDSPSYKLDILDSSNPQLGLINTAGSATSTFEVDNVGDLTIDLSGDDMFLLDENIWVCEGGGCPSLSLSTDGNLIVETDIYLDDSGTHHAQYQKICPTGYVWVPGSAKYGTLPGFCAMKYEAKKDGTTDCGGADCPVSQTSGDPWVSINQTDAQTVCKQLGDGYHLISDKEWMTVAENASNHVTSNWSGAAVGSGNLARGWAANTSYGDAWTNSAVAPSTGAACLYNTGADACDSTGTHLYRRTLELTNGEEIWDISGNVREWTDAYIFDYDNTHEMPTASAAGSNWYEYASSSDSHVSGFGYVTNLHGPQTKELAEYI